MATRVDTAVRRASRLSMALSLCLAGLGPQPARAQALPSRSSPVAVTECFQTVVSDAVLLHDLICETGGPEWPAISIGASNIALDLGGHVIFGYFKPAGIGVKAEGVEGVTIRNGTIDGFLSGLDVVDSRAVIVEQVTIRNLEAESVDDFLPGMRIIQSHDVVVRECSFEFLPVFHKEAVVLANGDAVLDGIELSAGSVAVNYGGYCRDPSSRSRGSVINGRFVGVVLSGVLVQCTASAWVVGNEFAYNGDGITVDPAAPDFVSGLTIAWNTIHGGRPDGIHLRGSSGSRIMNNVINDKLNGISLEVNSLCPGEQGGPECFYASGNLIVGNQAMGNFIDLYHHVNAVGNTWLGNACVTKNGAEIPECTPVPSRPLGRHLGSGRP